MTATNPSGPLVCDAFDAGLANRMRAFAGYRAAADLTGRAMVLRWKPSTHCPSSFSDLFLPHDCVEDVASSTPRRGEPGHHGWETVRTRLTPWVSGEDFHERAVLALRELSPSPPIAQSAHAIAEEFGLSGWVGLHLRWTDNRRAARRRGDAAANPNLQAFADQLAATAQGRPVWAVTDNPRALRRLRRRAAARIHTREIERKRPFRLSLEDGNLRTGYVVLQRTTSVPEALVDLLTLSSCGEVVGTWWSSFGAIAAHLGGIDFTSVGGARRP